MGSRYKIIRPLKVSLLDRVLEADQKQVFCLSIFLLTPFEGNSLLHSEQDLWNTLASELGKELILDQGIYKLRGEVLVTGRFYSPTKRPVRAHKVRIEIGPVNKTLYIFGNRFWKRTKTGAWTITDPEPLNELELSYSNAFGGSKFDKNPMGKGIEPVTLSSGETLIPLPNIELPDQLIVSKGDRPNPAGFGPLDITWPQRAKKAGTYDKKWLKERFPGFAEDMDWTIFNMAPEDQQIDGFFNGDEWFYFENMHAEKPSLKGRLPGLRVRCFVTQRKEGQEVFKEVSTRIDTVWFFPHIEKVLLIYRGMVEVADEEATDILHLLIGCEGPKDEPRAVEHYKKALEKRIDEESGDLNMLDESDLLPAGEPSFISEIMSSEPDEEDLFSKNMEVKMKREKEKAIKKLQELGLEPSEAFKEQDPVPEINMDNLVELPGMIQELEKKAEQIQKEMEDRARRMAEGFGLDLEELKEEARKRERRWPKFSANETIQRLKEFGIQDPNIEAKLREVEEQINSSLRPAAHYLPPSYPPDGREKEDRKAIVLRAKEEGLSLADIDLAYVDLTGLDLRGIDLSKAYLEGAVLHGTNLEGANLSGAILVRAKIKESNFKGANLCETNLGHTDIVSTDFSFCNMKNSVLAEAKVKKTVFNDAQLDESDFTKAEICECSFDGAIVKETMFMETEFTRCTLRSSDLSDSIFLYATLNECDFSEARLTSATFVKVPGKGTMFKAADFSKCCVTDGSDFSESNFGGAFLRDANFRGTKLVATHFDKADLSGADLSQCELKEASFLFSVAKETQFVKSDLTNCKMQYINLMKGSLQKALLFHTNLRESNLYGVDFIRVKIQDADFSGANLKKAYLERWKDQKT